jgi:predicted peptidase
MNSRNYFFAAILIFTSIFIVRVEAQSDRFSKRKYNNASGDSLLYRQLNPDANPSQKYPLIIFLHGSGERGNDNEAQLKWGALNFSTDQMMFTHPAIVLVPQCPANETWANLIGDNKSIEKKLAASPTKAMELLRGLIQELIKKQPIDTNRIYITGLSMGGFGVYDAIMRYPNLFAAAIPVCGGGDSSKASSIAHIPIWIFHGAEDGAVNPQYSFDMVNALQKAGAHPGFTLYPSVGHFSWLGAYIDQPMIEWLFRQHK